MIKDKNTLERIFTLVKQVKKPLIKIYPNGTIIGTDEQFASLNILMNNNIDFNIDIPYIFRNTEITTFMRESSEYNNLLYSPYEIILPSRGRCDDGSVLINHLELGYKFDELYTKSIDFKTYPILYINEQFEKSIPEMLSMKASDGSKLFNIDNKFLMSSFNAIHPATKSDRVELIIRDYDYYSYIAEFIIYKKKDNYQLHEFLRFRKL